MNTKDAIIEIIEIKESYDLADSKVSKVNATDKKIVLMSSKG